MESNEGKDRLSFDLLELGGAESNRWVASSNEKPHDAHKVASRGISA
jgi:hypothetical protein